MVRRIIYNGGRVSNTHLWVTIAFYELPRERSNARQLLQLETRCPSLKIKVPNSSGTSKAPVNRCCSSWASLGSSLRHCQLRRLISARYNNSGGTAQNAIGRRCEISDRA